MTRAEDVDAAIERASRGPRVASDPYWAEVDADDRLLAEEVVRLREAIVRTVAVLDAVDQTRTASIMISAVYRTLGVSGDLTAVRARRAALVSEPVTRTEDVDAAQCGKPVGQRPWWMGLDQWDQCYCLLLPGHDGSCRCKHHLDTPGVDFALTVLDDKENES